MVKVVTKKQQQEIKKNRFKPAGHILHETELAVKDLQVKRSEISLQQGIYQKLSDASKELRNQNIGLKLENQLLEGSVLEKKRQLAQIDIIVQSRNQAVKNFNTLLTKLSKSLSSHLAKQAKEAKKIQELEDAYQVIVVKYNAISKELEKLSKIKKQEEAEVHSVRQEGKKAKQEARKQREQYEQYKSDQAQALKTMRVYANRINRFYKERQMKPPVDLVL